MYEKDIIKMYDNGLSLEFIVKTYYRLMTKDDIPDFSFRGNYVITKKSYSMEKARRDVETIIMKRKNSY